MLRSGGAVVTVISVVVAALSFQLRVHRKGDYIKLNSVGFSIIFIASYNSGRSVKDGAVEIRI